MAYQYYFKDINNCVITLNLNLPWVSFGDTLIKILLPWLRFKPSYGKSANFVFQQEAQKESYFYSNAERKREHMYYVVYFSDETKLTENESCYLITAPGVEGKSRPLPVFLSFPFLRLKTCQNRMVSSPAPLYIRKL